ncbi:MAG: YbaK/EbsC family protein [Candidatus Actinomarinales bacterium]|nr:MAG: YbaK/EbsC family protein [Candidatus Actinomarinales bacterium]|tara:strand:- start:1496 stop:1972 length:477 start_codon:yes stop_codon:yes gene_type:complete
MKKKHNSQEKVIEAFKEENINIEILNLDVSTKTSQEAADAVNCDIKQIAKSIVFFESTKNKLVQIFVSGPNRVNLESFQNQTNLMIEKADADYVRENTGFAIGGVAPLGHKNSPLYFMDNTLVEFEEVWCAAGTPSSLFKLKTEDLLRVTEAKIVNII